MVPNHKNDIKAFAIYVELASLGAEMFAPLAIGAFLDSYSSTKPFGIISGILVGVLVVTFHIKRRLF
jgi:F0F1-type ATP synthase assembly protein I